MTDAARPDGLSGSGGVRITLSTAEAARYLGMKPQTLRAWRYLGRGPAWTGEGNGIRYDGMELARWRATGVDGALMHQGDGRPKLSTPTAELPADVWAWAAAESLERGLSPGEVLRDAIVSELARRISRWSTK